MCCHIFIGTSRAIIHFSYRWRFVWLVGWLRSHTVRCLFWKSILPQQIRPFVFVCCGVRIHDYVCSPGTPVANVHHRYFHNSAKANCWFWSTTAMAIASSDSVDSWNSMKLNDDLRRSNGSCIVPNMVTTALYHLLHDHTMTMSICWADNKQWHRRHYSIYHRPPPVIIIKKKYKK